MAPVQQVILQKDQCYSLEDNIIKGPEKLIDLISLNIGEVLLNAFDKNPNHISQIDAETNRKTTYAEMKDRAVRCALWLEKQGLACDDIIALCSHSHLDAYIPTFACYLTQTIISSWALELTLDYARQSLRLFSPKLIFAQPHVVDVLEEALSLANLSVKIVVLGEHPKYQSLNDIMKSQSSDEVDNYRPSTRKSSRDVAAILESSGTIGLPKGVMLSSEALLANAFNDDLCFGNNKEQINLMWLTTPIGVTSYCLVLSCILKKGTRIICNSKDPIELGKIIDKFKVNYIGVYPLFLDAVARSEQLNQYNIECLKVIRTGGSKLNGATFRTLKSSCLADKIYQGYGTTEIGIGVIRPCLNHYQKSRHSIGYVARNIQLKIVDRATNKILGANEVGEMMIKSTSMMLGYYKNPKLTRQAIDSEGFYHTGDVGYYDEKGEVFIMDRIVDVFEYRGQEFFSSEIEDVLYSLPAVMDTVVLAVPHELDGETPVAFVTTRPGQNITKREIVEHLAKFERYQTLRLTVCFLHEIPRSIVHKINKKILKESAFQLIHEQ